MEGRQERACLMEAGCSKPKNCSRCGFNRKEAARRKRLPLMPGEDGLLRKVIPRKKEAEERP